MTYKKDQSSDASENAKGDDDKLDPRILALAGLIGRLIARQRFKELLQIEMALKKQKNKKAKRRGNLADFFRASPLRKSGLKVTHLKGSLRKIDL